LNTKLRNISGYVIKALIILIAFGYIYKQVFIDHDIHQFTSSLSNFLVGSSQLLTLALVVILMFGNWTIETIKWKFLINKYEKVTLSKAYKAVLAGITVSLFTPNHIGEYGGRVFVLNPANRWKGVISTILGSISQLIITLVMGLIGVLIFLSGNNSENLVLPHALSYGLIITLIIVIIMVVIFFFNISLLESLLKKIIKKKKVLDELSVIHTYKSRELLQVLLLSLSRYILFTFQYYLLLRFFSLEVPLTDGLILISSIYFVMALVPSIALSELGIRGSVALFFFGNYFTSCGIANDQMSFGIISASLLLWIINLAVPAIAGSMVFINMNLFKKN
jgi:uncharacterized membrane protein YbhN (UPF0104 family)